MAQRFEGRNLDEALDNAARALGVEKYRVGYYVVVERRGFLGAIKRIVIEAEARAPEDVAPPPPPRAAVAPVPPSRPAAPAGRGGGRSGPPRDRGREGARRDDDRPRRGSHSRDERDDRRADPFDDEVVPRQGEESEEARSARKWLNELCDVAHLDLDIRTLETEDEIDVRLYGADARLVLSRGGELLDAIQVIANKSLVRDKSDKPIEIDCRGFKRQRADSIGEQAREAAEQVRRTGQEELLPAMSPVERRIVHLTLQEDAELTTESRGEGFFKRVAILLRKSSEAREP